MQIFGECNFSTTHLLFHDISFPLMLRYMEDSSFQGSNPSFLLLISLLHWLTMMCHFIYLVPFFPLLRPSVEHEWKILKVSCISLV